MESEPSHGPTLRKNIRRHASDFQENDSNGDPMPFLLIATWNDYEEGTQIEDGVAHCAQQNQRGGTMWAGRASGNSVGGRKPTQGKGPQPTTLFPITYWIPYRVS